LTYNEGLWAIKGDTLLPLPLLNFPRTKIDYVQYDPPMDTYFLQTDQKIVGYRKGKVKLLTELNDGDLSGIIHGDLHYYRNLASGERQ
jgi:hypothetical protein